MMRGSGNGFWKIAIKPCNQTNTLINGKSMNLKYSGRKNLKTRFKNRLNCEVLKTFHFPNCFNSILDSGILFISFL